MDTFTQWMLLTEDHWYTQGDGNMLFTQSNMIGGNPLDELLKETEQCDLWIGRRFVFSMMNYIKYHQSYERQNLKEHSAFNPFVPNASSLYSLETTENLTVFWCFQGVEKGCFGNEWVNKEHVLMKLIPLIENCHTCSLA